MIMAKEGKGKLREGGNVFLLRCHVRCLMKRLNGKVTEQRPEGVKSQIHKYHRVLIPALWAGEQPVRGPEAGGNTVLEDLLDGYWEWICRNCTVRARRHRA